MATPGHQDFVQNVRMELLPCGIVVSADTRDGTFVDTIDLAAGEVLSHHHRIMK